MYYVLYLKWAKLNLVFLRRLSKENSVLIFPSPSTPPCWSPESVIGNIMAAMKFENRTSFRTVPLTLVLK